MRVCCTMYIEYSSYTTYIWSTVVTDNHFHKDGLCFHHYKLAVEIKETLCELWTLCSYLTLQAGVAVVASCVVVIFVILSQQRAI